MTTINLTYRLCAGPGLRPSDPDRCLGSADGFHPVPPTGDTAPYNGVKTWRCPACFQEHRRRLALNPQPPSTDE